MTDEEWSQWHVHDGKGCPVVGQYVQCETDRDIDETTPDVRVLKPRLAEYIPKRVDAPSWVGKSNFAQVVRYRVRKPRGLKILEKVLQDLPAPTKTKETV